MIKGFVTAIESAKYLLQLNLLASHLDTQIHPAERQRLYLYDRTASEKAPDYRETKIKRNK